MEAKNLKEVVLYKVDGESRSKCPYCGQISMYKMEEGTFSVKITCPHLTGVQRSMQGNYCVALYNKERKLKK